MTGRNAGRVGLLLRKPSTISWEWYVAFVCSLNNTVAASEQGFAGVSVRKVCAPRRPLSLTQWVPTLSDTEVPQHRTKSLAAARGRLT